MCPYFIEFIKQVGEKKPRILSLFHNEFNKFITTRAQMLDSIYQMTLILL